jgi:hypothetical protein
MTMRRFGILFFALAMTGGCVGGSKGISADDKERLKPYVLEAVPTDIPHPVDVNFENKIHLVGWKAEPETAGKGQTVKVTYYWRCDDPVESGWALFTHVYDASINKYDNLDWASPIREKKDDHQILGPDKWEKGKVYVDEMTYKIPDWVQGAQLQLLTGIWKDTSKDTVRLRILSGPGDSENRATVGVIKTGLSGQPSSSDSNKDKPKNALPQLVVNKLAASDKITVDGKLDEPAWKNAASTGDFVEVGTGAPNKSFPVNGSAKLAWDDQNVYVAFTVTDPDLLGGFKDDKSPADYTVTGQPKDWTKETVEMMTDPGPAGDNKTYYELQINPQNKVFHSQFDDYNSPKTEPNGPYGHEDWDPKLKSAVVVQGTLDNPADKDTGYVVEASIPWTAFAKAASTSAANPVTLPPKPGDTWRMNFYAMKDNGGVAWSPIMNAGNFHRASRFGKVVWSVPGMALPAAAGSDAGAGGALALPVPVRDGGSMMPSKGRIAPPHAVRP